MSLKNWSLALIAAMLVAPFSASALGIVIESVTSSGASTTVMYPGEIITFGLRLENPTTEEISALGVGAFGYDVGAQGNPSDDNLIFCSACPNASVASAFDTVVTIGGQTGNIPGIPNITTTPEQLGSPFPNIDTLRVVLFEGIVSPPDFADGDGFGDIGLGGGLTAPGGDVHISVSFIAYHGGTAATEDVTIQFGTEPNLIGSAIAPSGSSLPFANAAYTLTVIPEPGTALLMGLGLVGLATTRRR